MRETPSDYIRAHRLPAKYGFGVLALALAVFASVINGDAPSLIAFKAMASVPVAIAWICLPQIYNPERSRQPFTPSFIERTMLEALVIVCAVGLAAWTPDRQPLGMLVAAIFGIALYFGIVSAVYGLSRRGR